MKKLLLAFLLFFSVNSFGQTYRPNYLLSYNELIANYFDIIDSSGWFQAQPESNVNFTNFIATNKQYFGMGNDDNFTLSRVTDDDYPFMDEEKRMTHHRYNQTYKGVKVEYAEMFLHHKNDRIEFINCKLAEGLDMSVTPALTEAQALTAAITHLGAGNAYSWQDSAYEAAYKDEKEDSNATTYPAGELIIAKTGENTDYASDQFVLAWKFRILSLEPSFDVTIYVNANTGALIKQHSNFQEGHANLSYGYGNNVYIDTRWRGGLYSHHVLRSDDANAPRIWTKKWASDNTPFGGYNCVDGCTHNTFDDDDVWFDGSVTTPHWAATHAWNYFQNNFNRNGYDNNATEVKILGDATFQNAYWNGSDMLVFGRNNGNHLGTRDIVGHEYTHAVTQHTAGLIYENEPGALNESFSDIFGYEVERAINGGVHLNWDIGEDAWLSRRMNNPANGLIPQPSSVNGNFWFNTNGCIPICNENDPNYNDCCGVHTNSGVQNYWFYLLTDGSANAPEGTLNNIAVTGIGADKARDIAFYNLDNFLGSNSVYLDAALGAIGAAYVIHGKCSGEYTQTRNAWAAVDSRIEPIVPLSVSGPSTIYLFSGNVWGSMPKNYVATGGLRRRINWACPSPWTWNNSSNFPRVNDVFSVSDFNGQSAATTITATDGCVTVPYTISFKSMSFEPAGDEPVDLLHISPNPSIGNVTIEVILLEADPDDPVTITVKDITGSERFSATYSDGILPASFNFSSLETGVYVVMATQSGYSVSEQMSIE